jgi:nitroreductase
VLTGYFHVRMAGIFLHLCAILKIYTNNSSMDSNSTYPFVNYTPVQFSEEETLERSREFYRYMNRRRTVREFSDKPVPKEVIENLIMTASTAPSGAHKQPWTFCVVSDPELKKQIREAAEKEEYESYHHRMSEEWLKDLAPLGTDWRKPFLEIAPWLIVVFKRAYELDAEGNKHKCYYVNESVGLACGFLLAAIHNAGLVSLTHTPSPMNFLQKILERPENERPFLLIPVGYPAEAVKVPDLKRKTLEEIAAFY